MYAVSKVRKIFTGQMYKLPLSFRVISEVYKSSIPNRTKFIKYCLTQWISMVLWRYGGHSKYNCIQLRANFHRSRAWFKFPHIRLFCFMIVGLIPQDVLSQWQWRNPKGYGWHQLGSHNNKHTKAKTAWDHIIPTLICVVLTIPQVKLMNHICEDSKILSFFYLP